MGWIPDGRRLRRVREQQDYTIELLAEAAGVGEKTIRNLEAGRTKQARLSTLKALAAVLDIEVTDIAWPEEEGAGPSGPSQGARSEAAAEPGQGVTQGGGGPGLPPPSRLEDLVEREVAQRQEPAAPLAPVEGRGPVRMLTPKKFQDIITAFVLHEGTRLWYPGVVLRQRGISEAEARVLGSECGVGARFLLSQRGELSGGEPFHMTAYTVQGAHTRVLQERLESRQEVTLLVRVVLVRPEGSPGLPQGQAGEPRRFLGFAMYGSQTLHPWTLVVEEVLERGREQG